MSKDGDQSKDFHNNCDNKDPTLILVETIKGYIFGGYTPLIGIILVFKMMKKHLYFP